MDYDADIWRELKQKIDHGLVALRLQARSALANTIPARSVESLYEEFARLDQVSAPEVDKAIRSWCTSRFASWPRLSVDSLAMLRVRLETASELLDLLITRDAKASDDPTFGSALSMADAARRVLINWWNARGRGQGCERWVVGQVEAGG